ncbi:MAG TPA: hypothetical protein ENL16_00475 [Candidatus Woesearchaeota archaeon]|nr:hypothetical protein [Candidatus Woesearchaeota archaeon]
MNPFLIRNSLSNAFYFSFISFIVVWLAGFLYQGLEKTTGKLNIGVTIIIVLGIILLMFLLAVTNIILSEPEKGRVRFWERIINVLIFILTSGIILGILGFLFWAEI